MKDNHSFHNFFSSDICKSSLLEEGEEDKENTGKNPHLGKLKFTELRACIKLEYL